MRTYFQATLCLFILLTTLLGGAAFVKAEEPVATSPEATEILFIGKQPDHPWGSHMYLHTCEVLAKCLRLTEGVETVLADRWPKDEDDLQNVKTVVVYSSPAAEMLLDSPHRNEFDRLMKQGVGLVTIHWASTVQKENFERLGPRWMSYLGGTWISNVGLSTSTSPLKQLDPSHPICRGWSSYELHDEYYLNPVIGEDAKPLLQVHTKDQDVVVGWAFERDDGGRAYGTTLGHYYRNFQNEAFRRTLINAILWSAHLEVPKEGAPVSLGEADLQLPVEPEE
ncbi:MAG: ThuA domain-containing protein [Planctomycetes bacterium]|nr:ThuA domain-containing protein [Planctomycetota bacterium]